jgi:hypothetical protein
VSKLQAVRIAAVIEDRKQTFSGSDPFGSASTGQTNSTPNKHNLGLLDLVEAIGGQLHFALF